MEYNMNPFKATGNAIVSIMNTVEALTKLSEDVVQLASNEVAALEEGQQIRLDEVREERQDLKAERKAKREELRNK